MIEIDPRGTAIQPHPLPCPECGLTPGIGWQARGVRAGCVRHPHLSATGHTRLRAVIAWNAKVRSLEGTTA